MNSRKRSVASAAIVAIVAIGCGPTVKVVAEEPIVINLNIRHEVRVKIDDEVKTLLEHEERQGEVKGRGIADELDDAALSPEDSEAVAAAKREGRLGERADGYLGIVPGRDSARLEALAERVNAGRRNTYAELAVKYAVPVEQVELIAGARRVAEAPPGEHVMNAADGWQVKPAAGP